MITEQENLSPDEVMGSLRRVALFEGLPDDDLRALVEILKRIKAGPGDLLFKEGDEDDRFFVVTAGAVEIVKRVPGGGEEKLAVRRAGDVFGEMALLNDGLRCALLRADGTVNEFRDHGPPLGMMAGFQQEVEEIPIGSGDMILVLSGGSRGLFLRRQ